MKFRYLRWEHRPTDAGISEGMWQDCFCKCWKNWKPNSVTGRTRTGGVKKTAGSCSQKIQWDKQPAWSKQEGASHFPTSSLPAPSSTLSWQSWIGSQIVKQKCSLLITVCTSQSSRVWRKETITDYLSYINQGQARKQNPREVWQRNFTTRNW